MERQLTEDIMRRVRAVYMMRRIFSLEGFKVAMLAFSAGAIYSMVSVSHVVANMTHVGGLATQVMYVMGAFVHTSFAVQTALIIGASAALWLAVDGAGMLRRRFIGSRLALP